MRTSTWIVSWLSILILASSVVGEPTGRKDLPGRQVKVSAIAIGFGGDHDSKLKLAIEHLETAGNLGVDIACLPEEFAGMTAEPIPGPTTLAVAELAKKHHMYIICPIREQAENGKQYNTAVLLDRQGEVAGCYRKVFVFWGEGLNVSEDGVKVFDTDFGRISILTCFDANFAELWQEADQFVATLDLDRTFVHKDFNREKVARLLAEHKGEIEMQDFDMEGWYLLWSTRPGVRVRDLCKQYQIETLREYRHRSRKQINQARKEGKKI